MENNGKEGYLMKEGGKMKNKWQKRWCAVRGSEFCYYKKKDAKLTGSINLKNCSAVISVGEYKRKPNVFQIVTPAKTYHLYPCEGSEAGWVEALNNAKNPEAASVPKSSQPQGETKKPADSTTPTSGGDAKVVASRSTDTPAADSSSSSAASAGTTTTTPAHSSSSPSSSSDIKCLFDATKYVLPKELMAHVFSLCTPKDLGHCTQVSSQWHALSDLDSVWRSKFEELGVGNPNSKPKEGQSWKQFYREYRLESALSLEAIAAIKNYIPFLKEQSTDARILEFHQIWLESFPDLKRPLWLQKKREFKLLVSSDFQQISWYMAGTQAEFIQGMVDFFWNVGAPESEIDRLNDIGAVCNPVVVGSWIDMSNKGGMDGGWYFPVEIPMAKALEAADKSHECFRTLKGWTEKVGIISCYSIKRDMGAAPPRQTEFKMRLPGSSYDEQIANVKEAIKLFGFEDPPQTMWDILTESKRAGLRMSVIITDEGFARIGILFPRPGAATVKKLCTGDSAVLDQLESVLKAPTYVEYFNLNSGFGYGVYTTGHSIGFHYCVNGPDSQ